MIVVYRITSIPSSNPLPEFSSSNKDVVSANCLESFLQFFESVHPKIIFLADHCSAVMVTIITGLCEMYGYEFEIRLSGVGINETMLESYKIASEQDDYVLFQECDYLYNGKMGGHFLAALKELPLLSPYDHPNFYQNKELHSETCTIKLIKDVHYRSTERNTMTWACHSQLVKENYDTLRKYGYLDEQVWHDLKAQGHSLYVPLPSFATHMVRDWLAPSTNWQKIWQNFL